MGVFQFFLNGIALMAVFSFPFALANIGWKTYMINGSWDALMIIFIAWYWVETKGKTLEEIDEAMTGSKRSDVPNLETIIQSKDLADLDLEVESK